MQNFYNHQQIGNKRQRDRQSLYWMNQLGCEGEIALKRLPFFGMQASLTQFSSSNVSFPCTLVHFINTFLSQIYRLCSTNYLLLVCFCSLPFPLMNGSIRERKCKIARIMTLIATSLYLLVGSALPPWMRLRLDPPH